MDKQDYEALAVIIGIFVLGILGVFALASCDNYVDSLVCRDTASVMHAEHTWSVTTGCMVEVNGKWLPLQAVRADISK